MIVGNPQRNFFGFMTVFLIIFQDYNYVFVLWKSISFYFVNDDCTNRKIILHKYNFIMTY